MVTTRPNPGPPLTARSMAEALLYMDIRGCEPVHHEVHEAPAAARHSFVCAKGWNDEITSYDFHIPPRHQGCGFLGGPEPSLILGPAELLAASRRLAGSVPRQPLALVPAVVRGVLSDLQLALACVQEAFRFIPQGSEQLPPTPDGTPGVSRRALFEQAKALRTRHDAWQELAGRLPAAPTIEQLPQPRITQAHRSAAERAPGLLAQQLLHGAAGPWAFAGRDEGPPARSLFRHPDGIVMWASSDGQRIHEVQLLEGTDALEALATNIFRLSARQRLRLRGALAPGAPTDQALARALEPSDRLTSLIEVRTDQQRIRFFRLNTMGIHRSVCLLILDSPDGSLAGYRLLECLPAIQQIEGLAQAAPHFPGPRGEPAEICARIQAVGHVATIAAAVYPLLAALTHPEVDSRILEPHTSDYARVFTAVARQALEAHYQKLWRSGSPRVQRQEGESQVRVSACPAGAFGHIPELYAGFPDGYQRLDGILAKTFTWVAWSYCRPESADGSSYDGLVWIDDHWGWFPGLPQAALGGRQT